MDIENHNARLIKCGNILVQTVCWVHALRSSLMWVPTKHALDPFTGYPTKNAFNLSRTLKGKSTCS